MRLENGWLSDVKRVESPHCDARPGNESPSLLVVHNISLPPGQFGGPYVDQLFTGTLRPGDDPFFEQIYQCHRACMVKI